MPAKALAFAKQTPPSINLSPRPLLKGTGDGPEIRTKAAIYENHGLFFTLIQIKLQENVCDKSCRTSTNNSRNI